MGAHNSDNANNSASVEDYLGAGDLVTVLQSLTFDESAAYSLTGSNGENGGKVLIARIGRTSIKAAWDGPDGHPEVALHVHDSLDGAIACHQGSIENAVEIATFFGGSLLPV